MTHTMEPQSPLLEAAPSPLDDTVEEWLLRCEMAYGPTSPGPITPPEASTRYGLILKHIGGTPKEEYERYLWDGFAATREVTPYNDGVRNFALQALGAGHATLAERLLADCNTRGEETLAGQGFGAHVAARVAEAKGDLEGAAAGYGAARSYFEKAQEEGDGIHPLAAHNKAFQLVAEQRLQARQPAGNLAVRGASRLSISA